MEFHPPAWITIRYTEANMLIAAKGTIPKPLRRNIMFIACNLRRIGNILTMYVLKEYLRILSSLFVCLFDLKWGILKLSWDFCHAIPAGNPEINLRLKPA